MFTNASSVVIDGEEVQSIVTSNGGVLYQKQSPTPTVSSVSLVSDKSILSKYHTESATLTATLNDNITGATVTLYNGNTSLGTMTDNNDGTYSYTYSANGTGDLSLKAVCDNVESSVVPVEDCYYYSPMELAYTSTGTFVEDTIISNLFNINNNNFIMEFDIKGYGTGGGLNIGATNYYAPPSSANYRIYIGLDTNKFSLNNRTISSSNSMVGSFINNTYYHMKLVKSNNSFTGYYGDNNTSIATKTASWIGNYSSWCLYWINWENTNYVKNIKIKFTS